VRLVLLASLAVAVMLGLSAPALAQQNDDADVEAAVNAAASRYDSPEVVQKIQANRSRDLAPMHFPGSPKHTSRKPARYDDCAHCPRPRKYDSREVVKGRVKTIDRSRTINTRTVVPVHRHVKESNHLVVHQNEIRETGVVQHNHTIIEKETRYVKRVPVETEVVFVTRKYRVIERGDTVAVPVTVRPRCTRGRYADLFDNGHCRRIIRVRG
jgi:hypothetical protein